LLLLVIAVVCLILAFSYAAVRWLFQPLGWLTSGMQRMGRGDLDTTIPIRRYDELGAVAETFNEMSAKIRDQVRAKQQLLLDVSHELRSPLTRMKVAAEFITEQKVRTQINADLHEMEAMIAEILESERLASEKGGLTLEDIDLHKLVIDLAATYGDRPPGLMVHADESVSAHVDPERTKTLLRNVIDNALKYSSDQTRPVEVRIAALRDEVAITVEDFGEGIPDHDLALVFEPFYRVDKSRGRKTGGYGLGLNLCRKIMDAHGGTIDVQSRVGEGLNSS
jgi:signal transduction histidine kinase